MKTVEKLNEHHFIGFSFFAWDAGKTWKPVTWGKRVEFLQNNLFPMIKLDYPLAILAHHAYHCSSQLFALIYVSKTELPRTFFQIIGLISEQHSPGHVPPSVFLQRSRRANKPQEAQEAAVVTLSRHVSDQHSLLWGLCFAPSLLAPGLLTHLWSLPRKFPKHPD